MYDTFVVSGDWLAERLDDVRVLDVREPWEFEGIGHVPRAVNVPFDSFRAGEHAATHEGPDSDGEGGDAGGRAREGEAGMLPGAEQFATLLGEAGVARDDDVVAYDDTHGVFAARLLVTCEAYGHDPSKLHLLNGDYSAWSREHRTTKEATDVEPTTYEPRAPDADWLVDRETVSAALESDAVLVDTREEWEFEEGHLPGAVRLDWRELVDDETRGLVPRDEIESLLSDRGITPDRRVVLYCNTARRISHTYVVLRWLGYERLEFYEGSLTEWERAGEPIER